MSRIYLPEGCPSAKETVSNRSIFFRRQQTVCVLILMSPSSLTRWQGRIFPCASLSPNPGNPGLTNRDDGLSLTVLGTPPVRGLKSSVPSHLRRVFTCWRLEYAWAGDDISGPSNEDSSEKDSRNCEGGSRAENARRTGTTPLVLLSSSS